MLTHCLLCAQIQNFAEIATTSCC